MFEVRSNQPELMDDLSLSGDALRKNLDELEVINRYLGGNDVVTDALKRLVRNAPNWPEKTISVADLGSGGGDLLRLMARWFRHRNLHAELTGVDANAFMITYAQEKSAAFSEIHYRQEDIFSEAFAREQYDIVCCSLFCHHFTDDALIDLFARMQRQARVAVIINDLHRHWLAYHSIRFLTWAFRGSHLVRHDAPLSVLRAFRKKELLHLLKAAGISGAQVRWKWAFRFQVIYPGTAGD